MYLDYGRALGLWTKQVPDGFEDQFKLWEPMVGGASGRLALWLLANQVKPVRDRETAEPSDWFQARLAEFQGSLKAPSTLPSPTAPPSIRTSLGTFHGVAAAWFLWGSAGTSFSLPTEPAYALPVPVSTSAFWIADSEVTQGDFAAFVSANPQWALSSRDTLIASGLADSDYLKGWKESSPAAGSSPVVSVSWWAAQAYVNWINASGRLAPGKKAVLPDDFQWEAAARSPSGGSLLNQGVWEWTASSWYPGQSLVWNSLPPGHEPASYARSLKGGLQNAKGSIKAGDRAGWPAAGTSPGLGFRLALVNVP
jgi:formylglycine-generating enzyme required for sulfatase activity